MIAHKHAKLIHAWAEGATVEILSRVDGGWHAEEYPDWDEDYSYRVKIDGKDVVQWINPLPADKKAGFCMCRLLDKDSDA